MSLAVYKSSAGSGKTYTLVKEYLIIVLKSPLDFKSVMAITFTNKAANEMKSRIIDSLRELAAVKQNYTSPIIKYLLPELIAELKMTSDEIRSQSGMALHLILHNYSDFAISTIDSFVHRIVKTFAYDLNLPINFETELDAEYLLKQAIDALIAKIGIDGGVTKLLILFAQAKGDEERDWHIDNDLLKFSKTLIYEDGQDEIKKLEELDYNKAFEIAKFLTSYIRNFESTIKSTAQEAVDMIESRNIDDAAFSRGKSGISTYFKKLLVSWDDPKPNSYVVTTINEDKWFSAKATESDKQAIESVKENLIQYFNDIQAYVSEDFENYILYKLVRDQIYPLALLNEISLLLDDVKSRKGIIHISEFNKRIADIVFKEPVPFIYERMGEKYKHFLIDEFQDTSVMQWQNLIPLVDNSLSEGHFNMLVGDGKQSIYRWRKGEVEQFVRLPKILNGEKLPLFEEREQSFTRNYKEEFLTSNYRSKPEIVEFNNRFFDSMKGLIHEDYLAIYANHEQSSESKDVGGHVTLEFLSKNIVKENKNIYELKSLDYIQTTIADGYTLSDIAILCRTNIQGSQLAQYLMENNVPVLSPESLLLGNSPVLSFLMSIIGYINNPSDRIFKAHILQYLIQEKIIKNSTIDLELDKCKVSKEDETDSELSGNNGFIRLLKEYGFHLNYNTLIKLPVYDLCEEIVRIFNLHKEADTYIQFFLDNILKLSVNGQTSISDIIEWWSDNKFKESVIIPEGIDAVRIMTIHKAKGLEFPVVIFPYANEVLKPTLSNIWINLEDESIDLDSAFLPMNSKIEKTKFKRLFEKETAKSFVDMLNVLYVTFTRPTDRLIILTQPPSDNKKMESVGGLIQYFLEKDGTFDPSQGIYLFGNKDKHEKKQVDEQAFRLDSFISKDWRKKIVLSHLAPSSWDMEDPEKNKAFGQLIHLVLSKIVDRTQIETVITDLVFEGFIEKSNKEAIYKTVKSIVFHPEILPFFDTRMDVKNEAGILLNDGSLLRPDRLIIKGNRVILIDYKTGFPKKEHEDQLNNYARVLKEMGYKSVEKYLIYIGDEVSLMAVA